jgi:hypothetical protein
MVYDVSYGETELKCAFWWGLFIGLCSGVLFGMSITFLIMNFG